MIAHGLAPPYPDELAYSIIARSLKRWHYSHNLSILRTVFQGDPPAIDLIASSRLPAVAQAFGFASTRTFAARHTLIPYYLAFLPQRRQSPTLKALLSEKPIARAQLLEFRSLAVLEPAFLRFCSDCVHLDVVRYGETYWHRAHQLPAVSKCLRHSSSLRSTSIVNRPDGSVAYWAATESGLQASQTKRYISPIAGSLADQVNHQSLELLSVGLTRNGHMSCDDYKQALAKAGYVSSNRVNAGDFKEAFYRFLGARASRSNALGSGDWWLQAARRSSRHHPTPVQHLVLQAFFKHVETAPAPQGELL